MSRKLRVAVVGVGHFGRNHARVYAQMEGVELAAVADPNHERCAAVAEQYRTRGVPDHTQVGRVDAVSIAVPTSLHAEVACWFLERGVPVLVEKPLADSVKAAEGIVAAARRNGTFVGVGHVERFNPVVVAATELGIRPIFIECHRLNPFSFRSTDVGVVLDLMIHDLDIVLSLDGSEAVQVDAVGVPVLTPKVDIANARLRFASGLIANLTASRVSAEKVRKFRVFSPKTYISVDFAAREGQVYRLVEVDGKPDIQVERTAAPDEEPLRRQLEAFIHAARTGGPPLVSGADGRRALALAHTVLARMAGPS